MTPLAAMPYDGGRGGYIGKQSLRVRPTAMRSLAPVGAIWPGPFRFGAGEDVARDDHESRHQGLRYAAGALRKHEAPGEARHPRTASSVQALGGSRDQERLKLNRTAPAAEGIGVSLLRKERAGSPMPSLPELTNGSIREKR